MTIRIAALDPSLTNMGLAKFDWCPAAGTLTLVGVHLVETEGQVIRKPKRKKGEPVPPRRRKGEPAPDTGPARNLDDLRRARELVTAVTEWCADCALVISEVPTGAQSSRAAWAFGIVIGILAGLGLPLVDVTPTETKLAVPGGHPKLEKREIIAWATATWPQASWSWTYRKKVKTYTNSNEHPADACAIAHAGVAKPGFHAIVASLSRAA